MTAPASPRDQSASSDHLAVVGAREAAKLLGVSLSTVNRILGDLPPRIRLSTRRFGWRVSDLARWAETRREPRG